MSPVSGRGPGNVNEMKDGVCEKGSIGVPKKEVVSVLGQVYSGEVSPEGTDRTHVGS